MRVVAAFLWAVAGAVWALEEGSVASPFDQHFPPLHPNCTQSLTDLLLLRQEGQLNESVGVLKEILSEIKGSLTRIATPTEAPCPGNFASISGTCLYLAKDVSVNWEAARVFCQNMGGDLAVLRDGSALARAIGYAKSFGLSRTANIWLGGRDHIVEGEWRWVTGEDMPRGTPFWGIYDSKRQPSGGRGENCAILFGPDDFLIHDAPCGWTCMPLCQVKRT
ncbi:CD209 antigen-like protein C [Penaeus monodon]|uniref:CD209 antigen-like protein C n=1 Tax=Penaeus monodon TaxID=6687 RepID=UPI0018A7009E|nr:CD209 antigen-like protein C [Penaeus monodon]